MNRIKGHLRYYLLSSKNDLTFVWMMVGLVLIIDLFNIFIKKDPVQATGYVAPLFSIFVFYFFAVGINNVLETFPFVMGLGSTRKEFYIGLVSKYAISAGVFSGLIAVFFLLERAVYRLLGLTHVTYLELWGRNAEGPWVLIVVFFIYLFILSLYNLFSLAMLRFRMRPFLLAAGVIGVMGYFVIMLLPVLQKAFLGLVARGMDYYLHLPVWSLVLWLSLMAVCTYGIGWFFVRRAEVKVLAPGT